MPWVDKDKCVGCNICVEKCPADTIYMENGKAWIEMDRCIHCGLCHSSCPHDAVRHDSEKIPLEVEDNIKQTRKYMEECVKVFGDEDEKSKCLKRMIKHFNKEKTVAEKTLDKLQNLQI